MSISLKSQIAPKGLNFNPSDFFISDKAEWTGNFISPNRPFEYGNHVYLDNDKNIWGCSKL